MTTEKLFSYGTLQYETVQLATFGRILHGVTDNLLGFALSTIEINDTAVVSTRGDAVHAIISYTGKESDRVQVMVFDMSLNELQQADSYEVKDYKRINVLLASGTNAWVYVDVKSA